MSWVELIITFGISVGAVVWGFNIYHQRGTWFLAGWNTMQKETKDTYNVQALCQLYGKCVMGCGLGLFLLLYGSFSRQNPPLLRSFSASVMRRRSMPGNCQRNNWELNRLTGIR